MITTGSFSRSLCGAFLCPLQKPFQALNIASVLKMKSIDPRFFFPLGCLTTWAWENMLSATRVYKMMNCMEEPSSSKGNNSSCPFHFKQKVIWPDPILYATPIKALSLRRVCPPSLWNILQVSHRPVYIYISIYLFFICQGKDRHNTVFIDTNPNRCQQGV